MKRFFVLGIFAAALILNSCTSSDASSKEEPSNAEPVSPAEVEVEEEAVGTEYFGIMIYRESPWGVLSDTTVLMAEMGLEPLEVKAGEVYRVTGKLTMGEECSENGKTVHFGFQETLGWSGLNVLVIDEENGIAGQSFDFDFEWTVADNAAGVHNAIQFCIAGPDHEEDDTIDFTIDELKFTKEK